MMTEPHCLTAERLCGAWTSLVTPFSGGELDVETLRVMIEHQVASGVDGLVVCGDTGEGHSLTEGEFRSVVRTAVETAQGGIPVMAATSTSAIVTTVARTQIAQEAGAGLALVAPPIGVPGTQQGIVAHFETVAAATSLPIVLHGSQNHTTGSLLPETIIQLSRTRGILGMVEVSGDVTRVGAIARHASPDFAILAGDDALTMPIMALGGAGMVSVTGNVAPETVSALTAAVRRGDLAEARRLHLELVELNQALHTETSPIPAKAAAALLGFGTGEVRLPLTDATTRTVEALNRALRTVEETKRALRRSHPEMRPTI